MPSNDEQARDTDEAVTQRVVLFERHRPFADRIADKVYWERKLAVSFRSDLRQLAYVGLLEALDRFEPAHGTPFQGYAHKRILGSVLSGIPHLSEARRRAAEWRTLIGERIESLTSRPRKTEALAELADLAIGLALGFMVEEANHQEPLNPYESLEWKQRVERLDGAVSALSDREGFVIRSHYHHHLSFDQIADILKLSRGRISQIHSAALSKLQAALTSNDLFPGSM